MSLSAPSRNPNVRSKIINGLVLRSQNVVQLEKLGIKELNINTNIGQPSFESADLPMLHISLGSDSVDQYLANNVYKDLRETILTMGLYLDQFLDDQNRPSKFNRLNLKEAAKIAELSSQIIDDIVSAYRETYPDEVLSIVLSGRDFNVTDDSDPKIAIAILNYNVRYQIDTNHPYFRLPYTLPNVVPSAFRD